MATFTATGFKRTNLDPDAASYIEAVEFADGEPLESGISKAFNDFVVGLKADNLWDKINSMAILAGARTLNGILVPLKGPSPSNINFVNDDYNRFGLKGDGSTKLLNSNYTVPAGLLNDVHISVWLTETHTPQTNEFYHASIVGSNGLQMFRTATTPNNLFHRAHSTTTLNNGTFAAGGPTLVGLSRNNSSNYIVRFSGVDTTITRASFAVSGVSQYIFARNNNNNAQIRTQARLSFYSTGAALSLSDLETRVSNLISAINGVLV